MKTRRSLGPEIMVLASLAGLFILAYSLAKRAPNGLIAAMEVFMFGALWAMLTLAIRSVRDTRHKVTVKRSCTADFTRWNLMLNAFSIGGAEGVAMPTYEIMDICQSKQCGFVKKCRLMALAQRCGFDLEFV